MMIQETTSQQEEKGINDDKKYEAHFQFQPVQNHTLSEKKLAEKLMQWGLDKSLALYSFRFNSKFDEMNPEQFLKDFLNSPDVRYTLNQVSFPSENIDTLKFEKLRCLQTNTDMFDKLTEDGIIRNDNIQGTYGDFVDGIEINTILREAMLMEESEHYCSFSDHDRKDILFRLLQLLVIGGQLNQYEDKFSFYLEELKKIYKTCVSVKKDSNTNNIFVESFAYDIKKIDKFYNTEEESVQNVLYVIVNPSTRSANVVYNKWHKVW